MLMCFVQEWEIGLLVSTIYPWLLAWIIMAVTYGKSSIRNRLATKPVILKVYNVKLSFDIWLVLEL